MIVALATMLLASCSFLEIDTENKIASEAVDYSNTSEMYKPVIGAYSQLGYALGKQYALDRS